MRAAVIVFPGSNRERDVGAALRQANGREPAYVWHAETFLPHGTDLVVLPGGFSYGDYLRCGAIAARAPSWTRCASTPRRAGWFSASATDSKSPARLASCPAC